LAAYTEFVIDANSDFSVTISLTDNNGDIVNLTGYSLAGTIRKSFDSELSFSFNVTTANANTGNVNVALPGYVSANMDPGKYSFDLNIYNSNSCIRILEGVVTITPSVF
jgi:hypothetical protein